MYVYTLTLMNEYIPREYGYLLWPLAWVRTCSLTVLVLLRLVYEGPLMFCSKWNTNHWESAKEFVPLGCYMWLQFIVEHAVIMQFNQFLHRYQPLKISLSLSKTLDICLQRFSKEQKRNTIFHRWLSIFFLFFFFASICNISTKQRNKMKNKEIHFIAFKAQDCT